MAKVKITGHASGTGVLTVTAPNTSTDRTITLPDSTGTLATTADVPSSITDNGDATAITIDSSERVGIGTGSPSEPLHVAGSGNSTKIRIQNTKSGTTTGAELEMVSEDGTWQLGQGRGSLHDGDDEDFHIYNSGTKLWIKKTNGNVYIPSGNLVLGSGLTIGGTGAANTLDDYEEGTFTPVFKDTSNAVVNGTLYNASYTKIGQMVFISLYYSPGDVQNGYLMNMSLPFTASSANHRSAGSLWTYNGPIPEKSNQWLVQTNTAHASFWKLRDNQISPTMQWDNGTEIVLSIAYFTSQ